MKKTQSRGGTSYFAASVATAIVELFVLAPLRIFATRLLVSPGDFYLSAESLFGTLLFFFLALPLRVPAVILISLATITFLALFLNRLCRNGLLRPVTPLRVAAVLAVVPPLLYVFFRFPSRALATPLGNAYLSLPLSFCVYWAVLWKGHKKSEDCSEGFQQDVREATSNTAPFQGPVSEASER